MICASDSHMVAMLELLKQWNGELSGSQQFFEFTIPRDGSYETATPDAMRGRVGPDCPSHLSFASALMSPGW